MKRAQDAIVYEQQINEYRDNEEKLQSEMNELKRKMLNQNQLQSEIQRLKDELKRKDEKMKKIASGVNSVKNDIDQWNE